MVRMRSLTAILALAAGTCALPVSAALVVTDSFGNGSGSGKIFEKFDAPNSALASASTGFLWTGEFFGGNHFAFLDELGKTEIDTRGKASAAGSYAYTIFDSAGGNTADTNVTNLQSVSVDWTRVDASDGLAKIIIRDADGNWFLSDDTLAVTANSTTGIDATTTTWSVLTAVSTLDDVTDDDTGALTIGAAGTPNLSSVTAGGFYMSSFSNTDALVVRLDAITFTGVPEPASMALLGLGSMLMLAPRRR